MYIYLSISILTHSVPACWKDLSLFRVCSSFVQVANRLLAINPSADSVAFQSQLLRVVTAKVLQSDRFQARAALVTARVAQADIQVQHDTVLSDWKKQQCELSSNAQNRVCLTLQTQLASSMQLLTHAQTQTRDLDTQYRTFR